MRASWPVRRRCNRILAGAALGTARRSLADLVTATGPSLSRDGWSPPLIRWRRSVPLKAGARAAPDGGANTTRSAAVAHPGYRPAPPVRPLKVHDAVVVDITRETRRRFLLREMTGGRGGASPLSQSTVIGFSSFALDQASSTRALMYSTCHADTWRFC